MGLEQEQMQQTQQEQAAAPSAEETAAACSVGSLSSSPEQRVIPLQAFDRAFHLTI